MSIAIKRNFTIPSSSAIGASEIFVSSSVASTSIDSGALRVSGGIGVSGDLSLGGIAKFFNGSFFTAFSSSATANTTYYWPSTSPGSGTSVLSSDAAGNMSWVLMSASGSGLTLNGLSSSTQYFSTLISGTGFTSSSTGSTHTFHCGLAGNGSTGLISSTTQTIFGLKTFASGIAITSGTASTNTTSGALIVSGGVGITGRLSVNTIALGMTGVGITPTMTYVGSAGTVITMSVQADSSLIWEGSAGQLFSIDNNLSTGEIFSVNDISGLPIISASAGQTITLNEFGGYTQIGNGLASTSTTTGSLRVVGGLGITGNVSIGGTIIRSSWAVGETINTAMYNYSDLNMSATTTISTTSYTRIANITYTPKSSSSYLWIEFNSNFDYTSGYGADDFWSNITVNGTEVASLNQIFISGGTGGGTRSGVIFPINARYTNSTTSGIAITVQAKRGSTGDDNVRVYGSNTSGFMRVQEIGR
jgi:hypothetical protein